VVRSLSFHRRYQCAHSGACCTAGWPIAIERDRLARVQGAITSRALTARTIPCVADDAAGVAVLAMDADGCAFYAPAGRRCTIHGALGHDALPLACRQFPRVTLRDPRGTAVTLSHFCPTAARLLDADAPVSIVVDPPAFPAAGEYVGLDATGVMPPLLRPGLLMDWDAWWECERLAVELVGNFRGSSRDALAHAAGAVHAIRSWRPGGTALVDVVRSVFRDARPVPSRLTDPSVLVERAREAIPSALRPAALPCSPRPRDAVINRFLAAHAFANWTAYGPAGLDGWMRSIETALALIDSGAGIREADLWLRHLAG
jgi:Fe-S-cluster containining protein